MALTDEERTFLLQELRAQEVALREACQSWDQPAPPGEWSVAAIAEHLEKTDRRVFGLLRSPALRFDDPASPALSDDELFTRVSGRARRTQAPEALLPEGRWPSEQEFWAAYGALRREIYAWIATTDLPLRNGRFPHPMIGMFDGCQWLLFLAAHGRRHTAQILERTR
jgi:hypothetical protein